MVMLQSILILLYCSDGGGELSASEKFSDHNEIFSLGPRQLRVSRLPSPLSNAMGTLLNDYMLL